MTGFWVDLGKRSLFNRLKVRGVFREKWSDDKPYFECSFFIGRCCSTAALQKHCILDHLKLEDSTLLKSWKKKNRTAQFSETDSSAFNWKSSPWNSNCILDRIKEIWKLNSTFKYERRQSKVTNNSRAKNFIVLETNTKISLWVSKSNSVLTSKREEKFHGFYFVGWSEIQFCKPQMFSLFTNKYTFASINNCSHL